MDESKTGPNIVFFGAGNRTSIAELFLKRLKDYSIGGHTLVSIESPSPILQPIGDFIEVVIGPSFDSIEFEVLVSQLYDSSRPNLFIPFMDSACRSLAKTELPGLRNRDFIGCPDAVTLTDKKFVADFIQSAGLNAIGFTGKTEFVILKPRFGFGSRNITKYRTDDYLKLKLNQTEDMIIQDFIDGPETSIDFYVFLSGEFSAIARERIKVSDGEVMETRTRDVTPYEKEIVSLIVSRFKLFGPVNLQLIGHQNSFLEINPRFSGGSTASIAAGWDAIGWLIQEYVIGEHASRGEDFQHVHVIRSRRDHIRRLS